MDVMTGLDERVTINQLTLIMDNHAINSNKSN